MSAPVMDDETYVLALLELAEYRRDEETNPFAWELVGWIGGDYQRIWFKSEGAAATTETEIEGDVEILYGRLITPWWDLQVGVRGELQVDDMDERARVFAALGVEGLAPGYFDIDATVFVSHEGDVSARATATVSSYVTQRLIAEPRVELEAAVQEVEDFGVGNGLTTIELGLRLRYEIRREIAPYLGVHWERALFETADLARAAGEDASVVSAVAGLRIWR
jgi:copper resistance protein B